MNIQQQRELRMPWLNAVERFQRGITTFVLFPITGGGVGKPIKFKNSKTKKYYETAFKRYKDKLSYEGREYKQMLGRLPKLP